MTGQRNNHLVPVLTPEDTLATVRKVAEKISRKEAGVLESKKNLFPSTQGSDEHVSGWHFVHNVCTKLVLC